MNASADSATTEQPTKRLSDAQLKELMRLIKGAHSVELKLTVPATAHRATVQGLPIDPVEAQPRQVYFFDTPDLQLYRAGVVVRARRIAGGKGDTVVKLRPVEPDEISADLRNDPAFNIEVDALPGGFVCSASFKGRSSGQAIRDAVSGKKKVAKLFSKAQREFFKLHAPADLDINAIQALGPTFILKGRFDIQTGLDGKTVRSLVAEMWLYPDGSRILELSTKCLPADALTVATELRAYLVEKGVPTNAAQETKTRTALEFYSKALLAEQAADEAAKKRAERAASAAKRAPSAAARRPSTARSTTRSRTTASASGAKAGAGTARKTTTRRTPPKTS